MPLGPIELGGRRAFVLGFDSEASGLPALLSGPVELVTHDGSVSRDLRAAIKSPARTVSFSEAQFARDGVGVVHTLWAARVLPILSAIRAGVRVFHFVDAPGSSYGSNARGALVLALARSFTRWLARIPVVGRGAERILGHRMDVPWPSATATLRTVEATPRVAPKPGKGALSRVVHWLPELGPRADESIALLEHLVPRTRALGAAVEILLPRPILTYEVRARRLERLGASFRFLPPRPWRLWSDRPELPGLSSELVRDLENHVRADILLPLLEDLLGRDPRATVVHGWPETTLASTAVVGLAGVLAGARVVLHVADVPRGEPEDLVALSLKRLAERHLDVGIVATDPRVVRDLAAWTGLPSERITGVTHAALSEAPLSEAERALRRRVIGLVESAFLVVAIGDLGSEAISLLLGIARRLLDEGVDAQIFHVGSTNAEARLRVREAGLGSRLKLFGPAPDEREHLRVADVALLLDGAMTRARAIGVPVVARTGRECGDEVLVQGGDSAAIADHLLRLARDLDLRRSMTERAHSRARERYAPDRFVEAVLTHYPGRDQAPVQ